jgi:prepilin-type processing-associated H-X9-DG protein
MANDQLGITAPVVMLFAFPREDGRWTRRAGNVVFVDGHFHKISVPGIETRSGESFGITATFHVVQNAAGDSSVQRGDIARFVVQNGRLMAMDTIATGVELVD